MTSRQRGWLLPPASVMLVAGVVLGKNLNRLILPVSACILALLAASLLRGRGRFIACVIFCFALGTSAGTFSFHPSLPQESDYQIHAVISDEVTHGSFGQVRVYLSDVTLDGRPLSGGAYWTYYTEEANDDLLPGKAVSFRASLYHPRGADNPGGYNHRETLLQQGVIVGLYGKEELSVSNPDFFSFNGTFAFIRHRLSRSLISALGEETGSFASALLLGMRSLIPSEDREAFSKLGIAHILTVSGFHTAVLIGALSVLFHLLRLKPFTRLACYAVVLFCYSALCGMSQPVIRASLFLILGQEGRILNRPRSGLHLLCASLFIMTLFSPVQVTSASFQLTFCAMAGMIWFAPLTKHLRIIRHTMIRRIAESFIITFGIQLGLLFPELFFFQRLPLLVFFINLPAMIISGVLMALFWIVFLFLPFSCLYSLFTPLLSAATGLLLSWIRHLGSMPGLSLWIHTPDCFTLFGVILLFLAFCSFFRFHRSLRTVFLVSGFAFLFLSLLPAHHSSTEYIQLSAGNADTAVLWDQDQVYVIDTGEDDGTLSRFLRARRLTPDIIILTHLHADHAGGLKSLLREEIPVRLLMIPAGAELQQIHPDILSLLDDLREQGTEIRYLSRGDEILLPSGSLSVLWPENGRIRLSQDANQYSLVSRIMLKGTVLLHSGDIAGPYEKYSADSADILKISHHGSSFSTSLEFIDTVSPEVALLSCQRLSRLQDVRNRLGTIRVYGTPESGALTVRFDQGGYTVIPYIDRQTVPEE